MSYFPGSSQEPSQVDFIACILQRIHKLAPVHSGQRQNEARGSHSRLVGGRVSKQGNLHIWLFLDGE